MVIGGWLPVSPIRPALGFTPLPELYWPLVLHNLAGYLLQAQAVKMWRIYRGWVFRIAAAHRPGHFYEPWPNATRPADGRS
jgi:hypothetical protein